jgi:hypothetical protein
MSKSKLGHIAPTLIVSQVTAKGPHKFAIFDTYQSLSLPQGLDPSFSISEHPPDSILPNY